MTAAAARDTWLAEKRFKWLASSVYSDDGVGALRRQTTRLTCAALSLADLDEVSEEAAAAPCVERFADAVRAGETARVLELVDGGQVRRRRRRPKKARASESRRVGQRKAARAGARTTLC